MKILEYYNNLRKKRIVAITALALMALVLVVTPLTALAAGVNLTRVGGDDDVLYRGESITLTFDFDFDANEGKYRYWSFNVIKKGLGVPVKDLVFLENNYGGLAYGLKPEWLDERTVVLTNVSCDDVELGIQFYATSNNGGNYASSDNYMITCKTTTLAQEKMGSIFDDAATMVTTMLTFMQQFLTFMTSNPILLIPLIVFLVGVAIFFLARLLKD